MQANVERFLTRLIQRMIPLWQRLMRLVYIGYVYFQRLVSWLYSIDLPKIPLSPFQWILLTYLVMGLAYMAATPVFEASDELWHFGMVEYIARNHDLPVQQPGIITPYRQEGSQPPLYYALAAAVIAPFDLSYLDDYRQPNPHVQAGIPGNYGNKNLVMRDAPILPLDSVSAAVYALRLLGIAMGAVTVWAVYQSGRLISPQRPVVGLVAAAITAFNPMFLFIAASVNNDNLVTMLNSLAIYYALLMLRDGFNTRRSLALAALIALGTLTKLSTLVVIPVIALAALWLASRNTDWRGLAVLGVAMGVLWVVLAGWWYVRNVLVYNELFGTATMAAVAGVRDAPFTIGTALGEFEGFRRFYWGVFGAANIQSSDLFYALIDFTVFTSMFGVLFLLAQLASITDFRFARHELTLLTFLLGIVLLALLAFFYWTAQTYATQGRLLFPFLAAISPLLAAGLVEVVWWLLFLLSPPDRSFVQAGQAVAPEILAQGMAWPVRVLGCVALLIPFTVIAPQYMPPPTVETLPQDAQEVYARFGDVELVGYQYFDRRYFPGEPVRLTFYWRVLKQSEEDLSISIGLIDPAGNAIGKVDSYPGGGTLRTTTWQPGKIYEDTYVAYLSNLIQGRFIFRVQVGWWNFRTGKWIVPTNKEQGTLSAVVLNVGAVVSPSFAEDLTGLLRLTDELQGQADFGDRLRLIGFQFDRTTSVLRLYWQVRGAMETDRDLTVFAHVVESPDKPPVGQYDFFPQDFPTRYWRWDERFITVHPISYPDGLKPGEYTLQVGWYYGDTGERLTLPNPSGEGDAPTAYRLFAFTVDEQGMMIAPELDELEANLPLFELLPEETATAEATSEATAEGTPEATLAPAAPVAPDDTAEPGAISAPTAEVLPAAEVTAEPDS